MQPPGSSAAASSATATAAATTAAAWSAQHDQMGFMRQDAVILVSPNDEVLGSASKYDAHRVGEEAFEAAPHRAFSVFLFNGQDELLLQRRAASKITFPDMWTNTCCSHPLWGQPADELEPAPPANPLGVRRAAVRKLEHELGVAPAVLPAESFTTLGRIHYKAPSDDEWGEHEVDYLLFARAEEEPPLALNSDEVSETRYVSRDALRELLASADRGECTVSPWFRLVCDHFLFGWWDALADGKLDPAAHGFAGVRRLELGDIDPRTGRKPLR